MRCVGASPQGKTMTASDIETLLLKLMSSVTLFRGLERADLLQLLRGSSKITFAAGKLVFQEGARAEDSMYVVVNGKFEIFRQVEGHDAHIAYVSAGEHFGEMALVTDQPRTASVRALENATVLRLGKENIFAQPKVAVCVLKSMFALVAAELRARNSEVLLLDASRRDKFEAGSLEQIKTSARVADIDYQHERGLDQAQMTALAKCEWLDKGQNLILTGATGTGKTWLACAFGNEAYQKGKTVFFQRLPILLEELQLGHADGSFRKRMGQLSKLDLLILDDFGLQPLTDQGRADLLEIFDGRKGRSSVVTSPLPVEKWKAYLGGANPTLVDALVDRVVSGSLQIGLSGESIRKKQAQPQPAAGAA